jgi:2-dehydropantoate 2-reductase
MQPNASSSPRRADYAILGAGAIGSILGAHLARAGHSVVMLVRERRARQIEENGLQIRGLADFSVRVPSLTHPSQLAGAGVLVVAMKTPGTAEALAPLRKANIDAVFSIQNGLWKNEQLAQSFGERHVLGALANTSGELMPSGGVLFTRNVNLFIGEPGGGLSERAQRIAREIDASGVRSSAVEDILQREWTKFVSWVGLMAMSVTMRVGTGIYLSDPGCARVLVQLVREMAMLADARRVKLTAQQSLLPLDVIVHGTEAAAIGAVQQAGRDFLATAPDHRMSSLQDLEAGRPLEVEETLGHAVRMAREAKLALPTLETFYPLVAAIDRTRRAAVAEPRP